MNMLVAAVMWNGLTAASGAMLAFAVGLTWWRGALAACAARFLVHLATVTIRGGTRP